MNNGIQIPVGVTEPIICIGIKQLRGSDATLETMSSGSAGFDVKALLDKPIVLKPGRRTLVPTGISCEIPRGVELQVRSRSGLSYNQGLVVLNSPGTIDSDYRGEIFILLANFGEKAVKIEDGMRVAQLVPSLIPNTILKYLDATASLPETGRGASGFGSTGVK